MIQITKHKTHVKDVDLLVEDVVADIFVKETSNGSAGSGVDVDPCVQVGTPAGAGAGAARESAIRRNLSVHGGVSLDVHLQVCVCLSR